MCKTRIKKLEVLQNQALRTITGCIRSTPIESLLQESNLMPLSFQFSIQTALFAEKYRRLPPDDSLFKLASRPVKFKRLKSDSWQHQSDILRSASNLFAIECQNYDSKKVMDTFGLSIDSRNSESIQFFLPYSPSD